MQDLASPCPMAGAAWDMGALSILPPSPHRAMPHPALSTALTLHHHHSRCQPSQVPCPQPRQALLPRTPAGTRGSANIPFPTEPSTMGSPQTNGIKGADGKPTPGWGQDVATHASMGDVLLPGLLPPPPPPGQPPWLSPPPHPGMHTPPRLPVVGGFSLHSQNKTKEQEGPGTPHKQLPIKSLFCLAQKMQLGSAPLCITPSSKSSIQVVPRMPGPGGPQLHPTGFPLPPLRVQEMGNSGYKSSNLIFVARMGRGGRVSGLHLGFQRGHPGKAAEQCPELSL